MLSNDKIKKRSVDLKEREANLPRGISLFMEIPGERTCDLAGIERFEKFQIFLTKIISN